MVDTPSNVRIINLGSSHAYSSLIPLKKYLEKEKPGFLISGKDKVNRVAFWANNFSKEKSKQVFRYGTMPSIEIKNRGFFERKIQKFFIKFAYPKVFKVFADSKGVMDDLSTYMEGKTQNLTVGPSPVIPDSLSNEKFSRPEHPWYQPGEPPVILGVGELSGRKDFKTLLKAFSDLRSRRDCRLILLGKGRKKDELSQLSKELGIFRDVEFMGFVNNPYPFIYHASALALTSRWEGLGFVLIEAMALGTPVASTDCPSGPREILQEGKLGPLVKVGDWEELGKGLERILASPPSASTLKNAVKHYSVSQATNKFLAELGLN